MNNLFLELNIGLENFKKDGFLVKNPESVVCNDLSLILQHKIVKHVKTEVKTGFFLGKPEKTLLINIELCIKYGSKLAENREFQELTFFSENIIKILETTAHKYNQDSITACYYMDDKLKRYYFNKYVIGKNTAGITFDLDYFQHIDNHKRYDFLLDLNPIKLEVHKFAPELNTLHFKNIGDFSAPQCKTIKQALRFIAYETAHKYNLYKTTFAGIIKELEKRNLKTYRAQQDKNKI